MALEKSILEELLQKYKKKLSSSKEQSWADSDYELGYERACEGVIEDIESILETGEFNNKITNNT